MKLAYISVHRDGTGYANQAIHNMLAIEAGGIDVVARAIRLSQSQNLKLAERVSHLESNDTDNVDAVVQHVLPHMFEYKSGVKNIGLICWETTNFRRSSWPYSCRMMDEMWVPNIQTATAIKNSDVDVPVKILPCACDVKRFDELPKPLNLPQLKDKCVFYTVGEMNRRKNVVGILRAFYSAFSSRDDVALVIKANIPGKTPDEVISTLQTTIDEVKKSLHIYVNHPYYPPVVCIANFLPEEKLDQLHASCDVFVSASHGESWGIPAHDALGFGNPAILSNWGSYPELTYGQATRFWQASDNTFRYPGEIDCGWLVKGQLTPCFGQIDSFPDLYTGDEAWFEPDVCHMIECMREAYEEWGDGSLQIKGEAAKKRARVFSYDKVGTIAKSLLDCEGE